ncbi:MAG: hypothetical protein AB1461_21130 [Thermodesulfobacteriota bacterium]|jgi:hypothetical protein
MNTIETMTAEQIRHIGLQALGRDLGPDGMIRFLQQFETGWGDYTEERHQWLQKTNVKDLADKIVQQRANVK